MKIPYIVENYPMVYIDDAARKQYYCVYGENDSNFDPRVFKVCVMTRIELDIMERCSKYISGISKEENITDSDIREIQLEIAFNIKKRHSMLVEDISQQYATMAHLG